MSTLEIPDNAILSVREGKARPAPGIAQRGSTLTEVSMNVRRMYLPNSGGEIVIEIGGVPPPWFQPTVQSLVHLLTLSPSCDAFKARRVEPACVVTAIQTALEVMNDETPAPAVVPTSCGGIQLEWHIRGIDLEIEIRSPSRVLARCEDQETGESWEERVFDFSRLRRALCEVARRNVTVPKQTKEDSSGDEGRVDSPADPASAEALDAVSRDLFWQDKSLAQLAIEQVVAPIGQLEDVWGAGSHLWSTDEEFEAFLAVSKGDVVSGN